MANEQARRDDNWQPVIQGRTDDVAKETRDLLIDPSTGRAKVTATISETALPTGAATSVNQTNGTQISQMYGKTGDTTFQVPRIDAYTHTLQVIDYEHHEVHAGSHFIYYDYDSDVDTASPKYYRLTTPNTTKWIHIIFVLYSEGSGTWQLFENPTVNAAGTTATAVNNDRNSLTAATLVIAYDPTSTADGTQIKVWRTGSGTTAPSRAGSESRSSIELILKQNEDYFLKFTPDANNAKTKVEFLWYEHINKTA